MNKNVDETKKVTDEEEFFEEDLLDEADIKLAKTINSAKGKLKKAGKIALVVGGVVVLGAAGLLIAGAVAKASDDEKKRVEAGGMSGSDIERFYEERNSSEPETATETEV